jgi:hypothetical protein
MQTFLQTLAVPLYVSPMSTQAWRKLLRIRKVWEPSQMVHWSNPEKRKVPRSLAEA